MLFSFLIVGGDEFFEVFLFFGCSYYGFGCYDDVIRVFEYYRVTSLEVVDVYLFLGCSYFVA